MLIPSPIAFPLQVRTCSTSSSCRRSWRSSNTLPGKAMSGKCCGLTPGDALASTLVMRCTWVHLVKGNVKTPLIFFQMLDWGGDLSLLLLLRFHLFTQSSWDMSPLWFFEIPMRFLSTKFQVVSVEPRMYIHMILSCTFEQFATVWATVCSSWVRINAFTSQRSRLLPEGDLSKEYIRRANEMMSRSLAVFISKWIFDIIPWTWEHVFGW